MRPITIILVILLLFCCMSHGNTAKAQTESDGGTVTKWKCYSGDSVVTLIGRHEPGGGTVTFGTISRVADFGLKGLRLEWGWGANDLETLMGGVTEAIVRYKFIIRPDGEGLYYDFSGAEEGEKRLPQDTFRCKKII